MEPQGRWNNRLKAVAVGLGIALTALTVRHWYGTFRLGYPECENCRPDFPSLYSGAKLMWENRAALYDLDRQVAIQRAIDPRVGESPLAFAYPPTTALLLMPLGWLSFAGAYLVMTLINALALVLALRLLVISLRLSAEQRSWLLLLSFCSFAVHSTILQGQTSLILLLAIALFVRSVKQGNPSAAGLWNGALFFKPQLLPVPFLVLAARRAWRGLGLGLVLVGALAGLSVFLVGWDGINEYIRLAQRFGATETDLGTNPRDMHNLRALVYYTLPSAMVMPSWIAMTVLVVAGVLLLNAQVRDDEHRTAAQWAGNLLAIVLLSPHLHAHDLALLIPAAAFVLKLYDDFIPLGVSSSLMALSLFPLLPWVLGSPLPPLLPAIFVVAFFWCVWRVRC